MKAINGWLMLLSVIFLFYVDASGTVPLNDALDDSQLTWTTGGDAPWFSQTSITHDGAVAAQCGILTTSDQTSWVEATVTGRVTVSYWLKISSDPGYSSLHVLTNGSTFYWGNGEQDWHLQSVSFEGGTNTIRWLYVTPPTNPTNWAGNAVWLDQVSATNITDLAPTVVLQPPAIVELPDRYHFLWTNINALVVGDIPMSLQWQRNGTNLVDGYPFYYVNSPSLWMYNYTQEIVEGEYRLVASNVWGVVTSAVCTVNILPSAPYVLETDFDDREIALGGYFNFWAQVYGTQPYSFQWYANGGLVPDATNQWYGFYPATLADAGFYHVVVSNTLGVVTSRIAQLTVSAAIPVIVREPQPTFQEVQPGDGASFNVLATGPEWLNYSWRKLGETNELGNYEWLYLGSLDSASSGFYHALAINHNGAVTSRVCVLAVAPVTALGLALDVPDLAVTNHHDWYSGWTPDVIVTNTHDGVCSARSPQIDDFSRSTFGTTVAGPTNISFWWRISAGSQAFVDVSVDDTVVYSISGETDWQQQSLALSAGDHQVSWTFRKEDAGQVGQDTAWVDQLVIGDNGDSGETNLYTHTLVAHYAFDDSGDIGVDSSGHHHDIASASGWGPQLHEFSSDAIAGPGALKFFGDSTVHAPTNVSAALVGSFTVSAWIKTTQSVGYDNSDGDDGVDVVSIFMDSGSGSMIPIALTGSKAAFWTGNPNPPYDDTLHSVRDVNTDAYTHIAVTRDQFTGEKKLYIDGVEDGVSTGSTNQMMDLLDEVVKIGGRYSPGYEGLLDDLQFYSGALAATNIAFLYDHPGQTVPDVITNIPPAITLAQALNSTNLTFSTDGDAPWFSQTNISHDGFSAAQSGAIGDSSQSRLETTVNGPGALSFWWKVSSEENADILQFWMDGSLEMYCTGEQDWTFVSLDLPPGEHILQWLYVKDGSSTNGADAAWLDQLYFGPSTAATLNLEIIRESDDGEGERYLLFPRLSSVEPALITQHLVQSPNALFQGSIGGGWSSSSMWVDTLDLLIDECTNGVWTLYINKDDPSEQRYTFKVSVNNLTTNELGLVTIYSPSNGSTDVSSTPVYQWSGPSGFSRLYVDVWSFGSERMDSAILPSTATNWLSTNTLSEGTNQFRVSYHLSDVDHLIYTMPVNSDLVPLTDWTASTSLESSGRSQFVVRSVPIPELLNPRFSAGSLLFGIEGQSGRTYIVQARTSLVSGSWLEATNFIGDGSLHQINLSVTNFPKRFFRVITE